MVASAGSAPPPHPGGTEATIAGLRAAAHRHAAPADDGVDEVVQRLAPAVAEVGAGRAPEPVDTSWPAWVEPALADMGVVPSRQLLQLRCPLPPPPHPHLATRPFRPGTDDEAAWIAVNNRAFAWHPDQAGQTTASLRATMAEPWFDADGFLLYEEDGRLVGSCWTKVHAAAPPDPAMGEIFVIGVDPDAHSRGLGTALTAAGLDWLHRRGLQVGMLYVEHDNGSALRVYERLGFREHHRRVWLAAAPGGAR